MEFHPAVIQGGKIVLESDLGLPDGQKVEVVVLPAPVADPRIEAVLRTSGSMADDPHFEVVMEQIQRERRSETVRDEATPPQSVRVAGTLDLVCVSSGGFELILDDGSTARGVLVGGDLASKAHLAGSRVLVQGQALYQPSGRLLRIDARSIEPGADVPDFWSKIPPPRRRTLDPRELRKPQTPTSGVSAVFGIWPGDETDEEWAGMIERLS